MSSIQSAASSDVQSEEVVFASYNIQFGYGTRQTPLWTDNERSDEELVWSALRVITGSDTIFLTNEQHNALKHPDSKAQREVYTQQAEASLKNLPANWVLGIAENHSPKSDGSESIAHVIARWLEKNGVDCSVHVLPQRHLDRTSFQPGKTEANMGVALITNCRVAAQRAIPLRSPGGGAPIYPFEFLEIDCETPQGVRFFAAMAHLNVNPTKSYHQVHAVLNHCAARGAEFELPGVAMGDWNYPKWFFWRGARRFARRAGLTYADYEGGTFPEGYFLPPNIFPFVGVSRMMRKRGRPMILNVDTWPWKWLRRIVAIDHIVGYHVNVSKAATLSTGSDHRAIRAVIHISAS